MGRRELVGFRSVFARFLGFRKVRGVWGEIRVTKEQMDMKMTMDSTLGIEQE